MYDGSLWDMLAAEQTAKRGYEVWPPRRPTRAVAEKKTAKAMTPAKPPREPASMEGAPLVAKKMHAT